jgi:hypothetical protein
MRIALGLIWMPEWRANQNENGFSPDCRRPYPGLLGRRVTQRGREDLGCVTRKPEPEIYTEPKTGPCLVCKTQFQSEWSGERIVVAASLPRSGAAECYADGPLADVSARCTRVLL